MFWSAYTQNVNKFEIENLFSQFSKINYLPCETTYHFIQTLIDFYFYKIDLIK